MKRNLAVIFGLLCCVKLYSQGCTVTGSVSPPKDTIVCGESVTLSAYGQGQGVTLLSENFNSGSYGAGWTSTQQAMWNNPCSSGGVDGTTHIWMGNSSPVPRVLTTQSFDLSGCAVAGVTICFDMKFARQSENAPCEGPDEPNEGVYLQYSTNNGSTWTTIHYFDPNGGYDPVLINWTNWCFPVPAVALTANTRFRWFQNADSGADYDHWGLDNVVIYCNDPTYNIVFTHDNYSLGPVGGVNPAPVSPTTSTSYEVVMSNGTITCRDTIRVFVKNPIVQVNAGNDTTICAGNCVQLNPDAKVIHQAAKIPTYSNTQPDTADASSFGGLLSQGANVNINVTTLNMTNVLPNSILSVCINQVRATGIGLGAKNLNFYLICPDGTSILLMKDTTLTGNAGLFNYSTLFNQTCFVPAGPAINTGTAPYNGSFGTNTPFNDLAGCTANGVWTLAVVPSGGFSGGTIVTTGWSITFDDPEISYTGNFNWNPTTNMTNSNTLTPTVCPPSTTTYTLTMSDTAGCVTQSDDVTVTVQATCCNLSANVTATQPSCGSSNGSINVTPVPSGSYSFNWADGSALQNRTGLAAGSYTVTITNSADPTCTFDTTIVLNSGGSLSVGLIHTDPTCAGGSNDGSVTLTITGGTAPFAITVDTGGTPITVNIPINPGPYTISNIGAGAVSVSVLDGSSCSANATTTLTAPNCCTIDLSVSAVQPSCGASDGSLDLTVTPTGSYSYAWSDGLPNQPNQSNLGAGTYNVTITNTAVAGCVKDTVLTLNNSSGVSVTITDPNNPTCAGNDGSATITVQGGTAPYQVTIDTGGTPQTITVPIAAAQTLNNLSAGTVNISVTDGAGCTANATATLTAPLCCNITLAVAVTQPTCAQNDGAVAITPSPAGSYTYTWDNGLPAQANQSGLASGTYNVTVTDGNGCTATETTVLNPPVTFDLSATLTEPSCGASDGSITITVLPAGNYAYAWDNGLPAQANQPNLAAGQYAVTVTNTDDLNCVNDTVIMLNNSNAPTVTFTDPTNPACTGGNDGAVTVNISGGTAPYQVTIDTGGVPQTITVPIPIAQTFNGLSAGTVNVSVTDAAGCSGSASVTLTEPSPVVINGVNVTNETCAGNADGTAAISVSGGTGTYSFVWSNGNTSATATGLTTGDYPFTVTDNAGCTANSTAVVSADFCCTLAISATVTNGSCNQDNASITVTIVTDGTAPYTYLLNNGGGQTSNIFNNLSAGNYSITARDINGCEHTVSVIVPPTSSNLPVSVSATPVSCAGGSNASAVATPNGGNAPFIYAWSTGASLPTVSDIPAGTYSVTVSDANGCSGTASVIVNNPAPLVLDLGANITVCENQNVTVDAGNSYTDYLWSNGQATQTLNPQASGVYALIVTDANGCTATDDIRITFTPAPTVDLGEDKTLPAGSGVTLRAEISPAPGSSGSYLWQPDSLLDCVRCPAAYAEVNDTATYTLTYTDRYGCIVSDSITIYLIPEGSVYFPNAFSPNADAINDTYMPFGTHIKNITYAIFNRWGEKVFESNSVAIGWDGKYKGQAQPPGIYVYYAKVAFLSGKTANYKGGITLIR